MLGLRPKETASLVTRDRVRLDADIYRPASDERFPVLLMRQPYGRAIASTVVYAHPAWYAAHGYIVVVQDVRGRGSSEGNFKLFSHEIEDGFDTVNWAASLPGSTGQVGMYGFSYQGMTQLYAAAAQPPALKTICPAMIGYDLYTDWAYEGGAFCLQTNLNWAIQLATETARLQGYAAAYQTLFAASHNIPLYDPLPSLSENLRKFSPNAFYYEWMAHPEPGDYWEKLSPKSYCQSVDLPMLHIGGWFDTYLRGTLHFYKEMAQRSRHSQHLLIGPWAHLPWSSKVGAFNYGPAAASPVDRLQVRWFDQFLKGRETGLLDEPSISLFEMGSNRWRAFKSWPQGDRQSYFLASSGLASISVAEGTLSASHPEPCLNDVFVHDPWRPVLAIGGHATVPAGSFERSALDCRTDVLTYTAAPLMGTLHIAGEAVVEVWCTADAPIYDLCAVLSEVQPDGSAYHLTQGYLQVKSQLQATPLRIPLQATCVQIQRGHALRLSLSAACFPAYPVNPGTGLSIGKAHWMDAQVITLTVCSGGNCPSQVLLPLVSPA